MTYQSEVLADSPIVYWQLDDARAVDTQGGTISGGGAIPTDPLVSDGGYAAHGDGSHPLATTSTMPTGMSGASVSVECWVNIPASNVSGPFVKIGDTQTNGWGVGVGGTTWDNTGHQLILLNEAIAWQTTGHTLSAGTHHIVVTRSAGNSFTAYVDGTSVYSGSFTPNTATGAVGIGGYSTRNLSSSVTVDNVALFSSVLSSGRVTAHYNSGSGDNSAVSTDSPVVWVKFDTFTSTTGITTGYDSSGNGRTLSHNNGVTASTASLLASGFGTSCTYDRVDDFSSIADAAWMDTVLTAKTVEARVQPNSGVLANGGFAVTRWAAGAPNLQFMLGVTSAGKAQATVYTGGTQYNAVGATTLTAGTNYTLALRWSTTTNTVQVFVNGVSDGSTATSGSMANITATIDLSRAAALVTNGTAWGGLIDEVSIYDTALSDSRLLAHHNAAVAASGTPVSLTGVAADVQVAAPAGTVAAGTKIPASLTGVTANVNVAAQAGTVTAGTGATPVSLTGVVANVQVAALAGTVATSTTGAVSLAGVPAGVQINTPAGSVVTGYVEWEQLESYTEAWATIRDQLTVTIDPVTRRPGYSLKVVNMFGDVVCELTEASIGTSTRTLNGRGGIDFTLPKLSPELAQVQQFSEVQLWRGGHLVPGGWYVVVNPNIDVNATTMGIQCSGLSYYFERRIIGGERPELLLNGGFEEGARYWNFGWSPNGSSGRPPDHLLTRDACEGGKALVVYGDSDNHRQFAWQGFTYTNSHPTQPLWIDIQCQARIDDYDGPAKDQWMLYADVRPASGSTTILYQDSVRIDETDPLDSWIPMSIRVKIAANTTSWVQVRLYPPHGRASFDQVSAQADTTLYLKGDPWQVMQGLVEEAQNVANGKSDLNIYTYGSWSGFKMQRPYPWKSRTLVSEAMDEIVRSRNGPDANMEVGARIRRLTVAPKQGARIGFVKPVFALGDRAGDARIVSYSAGIDGDEVATNAYVQSSWSGGGMTEVFVSSPRPDGLVLEKLYQAEQDSPTSTLLEQGKTAVKYGRADVITKIVMHPDDTTLLMEQGITIGAVATLDVHDGQIDVRADYRIVQIDLDPNRDQYTYTVVPEV